MVDLSLRLHRVSPSICGPGRRFIQRVLQAALSGGEYPAAGSVRAGGMDQFERMAAVVSAFFFRGPAVCRWIATGGVGSVERQILLGKCVRRSLCRDAGVDGGGRFVSARMGSAKPRDQFGSAVEESNSATGDDGTLVAAGVGAVDYIARSVGRSVAGFPHCHRSGCDVAVGSVRVPAAICSRSGSDGGTAGVAAGI